MIASETESDFVQDLYHLYYKLFTYSLSLACELQSVSYRKRNSDQFGGR